MDVTGESDPGRMQHERAGEYVGAGGDDNRGEQRRLLVESKRARDDVGLPVVADVRRKCDGASRRPNRTPTADGECIILSPE